MRLLARASLRHLLRHPWQFGLSVLGIGLGVAIVVSIDIANHSAARSFTLSMDAVAGKATHHILGPAAGIPDSVYTALRVRYGIDSIAPVVESQAVLDGPTPAVYSILGVDVFAERAFRPYLSETLVSLDDDLAPFLTAPGAAVVSASAGRRLGKDRGDSLQLRIDGRDAVLRIAGFVPDDVGGGPALDNLLITDIATAQEVTGRVGRIDRIDVIVPDSSMERRLRTVLPPAYRLQASGSRSRAAEQMVDAFDVNLSALSLLALIVGMFLVFSTITFSVVQRKVMLGTLRSLGVTSREIERLIVVEALMIGVAGTALGFGLGLVLATALLKTVSRTLTDLYFVAAARAIVVDAPTLVKGAALGIGGTILSALKPAREAARTHPRLTMIRSAQEVSLRAMIPVLSLAGTALLLAGGGVLALPGRNLAVSYGGILLVIAGFALLTPLAMVVLEKVSTPICRTVFGIPGAIASRSIVQNLSRTHVAIAALALAVASTVGVGTMISTFRATVVEWLEIRLRGDLFVSPPNLVSRRSDTVMPDTVLSSLRLIPGIRDLDFFRHLDLYQDETVVQVIGSGLSDLVFGGIRFTQGDPRDIRAGLRAGDIVVSEPFAFRRGLEPGSLVQLHTDRGDRDFRVAGVYYDYASDQGFVLMEYGRFREHWDVSGLSGIRVTVEDPDSIAVVQARIEEAAPADQRLLVRTNRVLRESSIEIFDRTFTIARVLQLMAVIVAFVAILSTLMAVQMERTRELAVMRAAGLLPGQLFIMVNLQTLMMGLIAGLLALPLGNLLAAILVYIINRRSFGWTMQMEVMPFIMLEAVALAVGAALLAGLYPGIRMSRASPADALRNE